MDEQLRPLQLTQLEILKMVDGICRKHEIPYSLYAGTLLGAVRHKGFIPWDDDLDICMSRENYDRFLQVWQQEQPAGYLLQNKDNTPAFTQSFTKIRKDHTTFLHSLSEAGKYHTGIFIDIFPIDRIPNGKLRRSLYYWDCMRYQLYTREFVPQQYGFANKLGSSILLALTSGTHRAKMRKKLLKRLTAFNQDNRLETVATETVGSVRKSYAPDMTEKYTTLQFEDGEFMCFAGWHDHLTRKFGDYMQLPPVEQRTWTHHPVCVDFNYNYEELNT